MAIRIKGTKFQVDVTVAGVRAPRVSCDTKAEAERIEAEFRAKLLTGADPSTLTGNTITQATRKGTLGTAIQVAYRHQWQGRKSEVTALRNAEAWSAELGADFPLEQLTTTKIGEVCDRWGEGGNAAGTINRKLAALSVVLRLAVEDGFIPRVPRLPKRKEYEGRLRYFTDDEVESLLEFAPDEAVRMMFLFAVETGMRLGEIRGLTKRDVDLRGTGLVLLGETKGNKRRSIPLTAKAHGVARYLLASKMDHEKVFPEHLDSRHLSRIIAGWKFARGIPAEDEACFHTFRHTTCARLIQRGINLVIAQRWMGHADISTTLRYSHLAPDSLDLARAALEGN
jgi:integrase